MSHKGTIPLDSKLSNLENCLKGVENCDVFLGFIRPLLGTGVLDRNQKSITEQEFDVALRVNMLRFVLADYRVVFARQFLKMMQIPNQEIPYSFTQTSQDGQQIIKPNRVVHAACLEMYDTAIQSNINPATARVGNWVQQYKNLQDITLHVEAQIKDVERIKKLLDRHE